MITGAVCMSHSPLLDRNRTAPDEEKKFNAAVRSAAAFAAAGEPDICVVFFPDHLNGFFYDLLPSFCVGAGGHSIGDYGTTPGKLDIPEDIAMDCVTACIESGIDAAVSLRINVDHGAVQPLELLSVERSFMRMIPIFINCAAAPRPTFARVRALGTAVGEWADKRPERILLVGSGGLSHDPPLPALKFASAEVRSRLIDGRSAGHSERVTRQKRVFDESVKFANGTSSLRGLNADWDREFLAEVVRGNLDSLDGIDDDSLTEAAGRGAHEIRCWIAALAAARSTRSVRSEVLYYAPIAEWITGMGIVASSVS